MDLGSLLFDLDDPPEETHVHRAAYAGDVAALRRLPLIQRSRQLINRRLLLLGATPLRLAVSGDSVECVCWLLENGAEVDLADMKAQTPLFVAIKDQHLECAKVLLEHGADPHGSTDNLSTPLAQCCQVGWLPGIQLLLMYGADPEAGRRSQNVLSLLPLHVAAVHHHLDCFLALLLAGCRPDSQHSLPHCQRSNTSHQQDTSHNTQQTQDDTVSLPHALLRHRCAPEFVQLLYVFGGNLWHKDGGGQLAWQTEPSNHTTSLLKTLAGSPHTLENLCRLTVRRCVLTCGGLHRLSRLPLPPPLLRRLLYSDTVASLIKFGTNRFSTSPQ